MCSKSPLFEIYFPTKCSQNIDSISISVKPDAKSEWIGKYTCVKVPEIKCNPYSLVSVPSKRKSYHFNLWSIIGSPIAYRRLYAKCRNTITPIIDFHYLNNVFFNINIFKK